MGLEDFNKYDLALREWERVGYVSDREGSPFVYYHSGLNEFRLDRYLITHEQLAALTVGGWVLKDTTAPPVIPSSEFGPRARRPVILGEIIGCKTEVWFTPPDEPARMTPGYWIVLSLGQIEIVPGSISKKPIRVVGDDS